MSVGVKTWSEMESNVPIEKGFGHLPYVLSLGFVPKPKKNICSLDWKVVFLLFYLFLFSK